MLLLIGYLVIMNAVALILMLTDKRKAKQGQWRIPEATLMGVAAIGGSLGALLGMNIFRHKTKHPKFYIGLPLLLGIHIAALIWLVPMLL